MRPRSLPEWSARGGEAEIVVVENLFAFLFQTYRARLPEIERRPVDGLDDAGRDQFLVYRQVTEYRFRLP